VKNILLIQSWRYKTLAVIKRHKTTYLYLFYQSANSATKKLCKKRPFVFLQIKFFKTIYDALIGYKSAISTFHIQQGRGSF